MRKLSKFAYLKTLDRTRRSIIEWFNYKNSPNPDPATVELSTDCLSKACPALKRLLPRNYMNWGGSTTAPTDYENLVLQLKAGDTVVFDGKHYKLGKFLGAGDATHVYELADLPGVIRIPFLVASIHYDADWPQSWGMWQPGRKGIQYTQNQRIERIREIAKRSLAALKKKYGAVEIIEEDPMGRFAVVEKVHGSVTGLDLIARLWGKDWNMDLLNYDNKTLIYPRDFKPSKNFSPIKRNQLDLLLQLMAKNNDAYVETEYEYPPNPAFEAWKINPGSFSDPKPVPQPLPPIMKSITKVPYPARARQYLWDENDQRWRLIDAD